MRCVTCRSTRSPISPTCRSSSTPSIPGQAPQVVEDQVTYPLTTRHADRAADRKWCAASRSSACRSSTSFSRTAPTSTGRARACSNISTPASARLPAGVTPTSGPDATGVGWVYQYAVTSPRTRRSPNCARSRTGRSAIALAKAEGVAEVASVGGFVKQYNVVVDPGRHARRSAFRSTRCAKRSAPATSTSAAARSNSPSSNTWCAAAAISRASTTSRTSS